MPTVMTPFSTVPYGLFPLDCEELGLDRAELEPHAASAVMQPSSATAMATRDRTFVMIDSPRS